MKKILVSTLVVLLSSTAAWASDFAVAVGARTDNWNLNPSSSSVSTGGQTGYQAGVLAFMDLAPSVQFRTGFLYTVRNYTYTPNGGSETDYSFQYFDIPLTAMYRFNDFGGVFAGGLLALNVGKSANNGGSTTGTESSVFGYELGASFKFAPQMGAELYYENIPGNIISANGTSLNAATSVVLNFLITFE